MLTQTEEKYVLTIPADVDKRVLDEFYDDLARLERDGLKEAVIDCSSLEHVASRHIMLLWQAFNTCQELGINVRLTSVTYALTQALKLLDIYNLFLDDSGQLARKKKIVKSVDADLQSLDLALRFEASTKGVADALMDFQRYLDGLGLSELSAFEMATVFYEIATNIRLHANLKTDDRVEFSALLKEDRVYIKFTDPGAAFDPTSVRDDYNPGTALKNHKKSGLGLTLVKRIVDSLTYARNDNRINELKLEKRIKIKGGQQ
jgi:anti-sigma regulatory factor (Ser/Thr protein kinase)/anti-anti-sigma regulatory factor